MARDIELKFRSLDTPEKDVREQRKVTVLWLDQVSPLRDLWTMISNPEGIMIIQPSVAKVSRRDSNHSAQRCDEGAMLGWCFPDSSTLKGLNLNLARHIIAPCHNHSQRFSFIPYSRLLREELHRYLGGILTNLDCQPIIAGSVEDHVHLLCALSRTCEAAEMVKEAKRGSSLWLKTKGAELHDFAWQSGYGIFRSDFRRFPSVRDYIAGQEEHHRKVSFQDELRHLLRRYEIEFDERYVWD